MAQAPQPRSPGSRRHWKHVSYVGTAVARPSGPLGPGRHRVWGSFFTLTLVPAPPPSPASPSLRWVRGGSWQLSAWIPAGQRAARGECARVRGHVCGRRGHVCGQGGAEASPPADGHSLMKRWLWPCQLSPSPWTNGCLTCLWGHRAERVSGPGGGGPGTPPSAAPSASCHPEPRHGLGSPLDPPPNLDADFFLALLEGVAAQHFHFGHDLGRGGRGVVGWREARGRRGHPRVGGQHPPSRRRPSPARSPGL